MQLKLIRCFIASAAVLLLLTGIAKLISSAGSSRILQNLDPIFFISFQKVFWIVGMIEIVIACFCLFFNRPNLQTVLIAWLASNFVLYRFGLLWIGYRKPCPCLGNLTDALHISPQTADHIMRLILGYLLLGSYAILFWLWKENRRACIVALSSEKAISAIS